MAEIRDAGARADVAVAGAMPLLDADLEDEPIFLTQTDLMPLPAPEEEGEEALGGLVPFHAAEGPPGEDKDVDMSAPMPAAGPPRASAAKRARKQSGAASAAGHAASEEAGQLAKAARARRAAAAASTPASTPAEATAAAPAAVPADAPAARAEPAPRGRRSAFTEEEKRWIAEQCSSFFGHIRNSGAPPLNYLRDDVAKRGLESGKLSAAFDTNNPMAFNKFVEQVRHVARSWVEYVD
jgi:hypothetical protein